MNVNVGRNDYIRLSAFPDIQEILSDDVPEESASVRQADVGQLQQDDSTVSPMLEQSFLNPGLNVGEKAKTFAAVHQVEAIPLPDASWEVLDESEIALQFDDIDRLSHGKYNLGQLKLDANGDLDVINNHKFRILRNFSKTTPAENRAVRKAVAHALIEKFCDPKLGAAKEEAMRLLLPSIIGKDVLDRPLNRADVGRVVDQLKGDCSLLCVLEHATDAKGKFLKCDGSGKLEFTSDKPSAKENRAVREALCSYFEEETGPFAAGQGDNPVVTAVKMILRHDPKREISGDEIAELFAKARASLSDPPESTGADQGVRWRGEKMVADELVFKYFPDFVQKGLSEDIKFKESALKDLRKGTKRLETTIEEHEREIKSLQQQLDALKEQRQRRQAAENNANKTTGFTPELSNCYVAKSFFAGKKDARDFFKEKGEETCSNWRDVKVKYQLEMKEQNEEVIKILDSLIKSEQSEQSEQLEQPEQIEQSEQSEIDADEDESRYSTLYVENDELTFQEIDADEEKSPCEQEVEILDHRIAELESNKKNSEPMERLSLAYEMKKGMLKSVKSLDQQIAQLSESLKEKGNAIRDFQKTVEWYRRKSVELEVECDYLKTFSNPNMAVAQ